jgi:hypothetical protein
MPIAARHEDPAYTAPHDGYLDRASDALPHFHGDHAAHAHQDAGQLGAMLAQDAQAFPPPPNPDEEFYDDERPRARRKGLVTVAAVFGLAILGTAAAFGYRAVFGGSGTSSPPPVIRASSEPTKVAPPPPVNNDASPAKLTYERFGDRSQNEQVVAREEQPIDMRDPARAPTGANRSVPPGTLAPAGSAMASAPAASGPAGNPPSVLTEPKRVRTVQIRPDQPDAAARPQIASAAPAPAARQNPAIATATPPNAPLDVPAMNTLPPPASTAPRPQRAQPSANAPLSLAPDSNPPAAPAARTQAPTRVASAPAAGGNFLVQISSQRSEADAQAAFRSMQGKYSSVLGDRQAVIRRADLGEKGTYYRAMVGPFATREQAVQLCGSLKAAGGDCVVQGN